MIWPGKGNAAKPPGPNGLISRTCFFWASFERLVELAAELLLEVVDLLALLRRQVELAAHEEGARDRYRPEDRPDRPDRPDSP